MIGGLTDSRQHHLGDIDPEAVGWLARGFGGRLDGAAGDLGITQPGSGILGGRIIGGGMERHPRIAAQIGGFDRTRHHAHDDVAIAEFDLDPTDPWRPVAAEGGEGLVTPEVKYLAHPLGECRFRGGEVGPVARFSCRCPPGWLAC